MTDAMTGAASSLLSMSASQDGIFTGTINQHGTLYVISGANAARTAAQIKAGTGAEDAGSFFVNLGSFDFTFDLTNTVAYVPRFFHAVLENDNGFSNVVSIEFELKLPVPWDINVDGLTITVVSNPTFNGTSWSIQTFDAEADVITSPMEIV